MPLVLFFKTSTAMEEITFFYQKYFTSFKTFFSVLLSWNGLLRILLIHFFCTMSFFPVNTAFRNNGTAASTNITKTTKTVTFAATLSTSREIPHRLDQQHLRLWTSSAVRNKCIARNLHEWNSGFENEDWRQVVEEECFLKHPISGKKFHPFWRHVLEDATGMKFEDPSPVPNYLNDWPRRSSRRRRKPVRFAEEYEKYYG